MTLVQLKLNKDRTRLLLIQVFLLYMTATYTHVPIVPDCYCTCLLFIHMFLLYLTATVPVCNLYTCSCCTWLLLYLSATYTHVPAVPDCYWYACSQCKWLLPIYILDSTWQVPIYVFLLHSVATLVLNKLSIMLTLQVRINLNTVHCLCTTDCVSISSWI